MNLSSLFHPLVARWFVSRFGAPTDAQSLAWPRIAAGEHVLVTAPTGRGKTLAAFLCAIDRLVRGEYPPGAVRVLYVSPLKALNNDVRRNLELPLAELGEVFRRAGEPFPAIRVATRDGDTPQAERRRMLRHPPDILVTTPESLNLLLTAKSGRELLSGTRCVVLDEIHAMLGDKRGTHCVTAADRLVFLCGEFQRVALSATVKPVETAVAFVGGFTLEGPPEAPRYRPRPVAVVVSAEPKRYDLRVCFPEEAADRSPETPFWEPLAARFREIVARNRSTLFFVNSRRMCERLARMLNAGEEGRLAFAHHGSLSRELRRAVEERFKAGELRAVVATNSLELGIDVGELDEVVLVQSPPSVAAAVQRVGRAGHAVGLVSRGTLFPTHGADFLEAAVLATAVPGQDIESVSPVAAPLDVLAQVLVSMTAGGPRSQDELFAAIRTSWPYRDLSRERFDLVLDMLCGRYGVSRLRELRPRLRRDPGRGTVEALTGAVLELYASGGTIPDRGMFVIRHAKTGARLGELDEVFVWEDVKVGRVFTFGAQRWRVERLTHSDVLVTPAKGGEGQEPFWIGESRGRDFHFSERLALFLEEAERRLNEPEFLEELVRERRMESAAAKALVEYLRSQRRVAGAPLPHRRHLLVEHTSSGPGGAPGAQLALHLPWGLALTRPYALALDAAYEARFGVRPHIHAANDCLAIVLPEDIRADELLSLVRTDNLEALLRRRLEGSGVFGAAFREAAGRALVLGKSRFGERMPLWMTRLRAQRLFEAVNGFDDFPLLLEAWRTCLRETFDMENLLRLLGEIKDGLIAVSEVRTASPSPMAREMTWRQVSERFMYLTDEAAGRGASGLRPDLLREVVQTPGLRPAVSRETIAVFEQKRRRLWPGYSPGSALELADWLGERLLLPLAEWELLRAAMIRDHGAAPELQDPVDPVLAGRLVRLAPSGAAGPLLADRWRLPEIVAGLYGGVAPPGAGPLPVPAEEDAAEAEDIRQALAAEWLTFAGPLELQEIAAGLGLDPETTAALLDDLVEAGRVVCGALARGEARELYCDAANFESLLRLERSAARPAFEPVALSRLPLFLALRQGLAEPGKDAADLAERLERLSCLPLPARLWEDEVLAARMAPEAWSGLDALVETALREDGLSWRGRGMGRVFFAHQADLDLPEPPEASVEDEALLARLFPDPRGRYDFSTLLLNSGPRAAALSAALWDLAWRGRVGNDAFAALRKGLANDFKVPDLAAITRSRPGRGRGPGRAARAAWSGSLPYAGNWLRLDDPGDVSANEAVRAREPDALDALELCRERARLALFRYGVVFRELLAREAPEFSFSALFRALRLMELAGEVVSGCFFEGVPGAQFALPEVLAELASRRGEAAIFWLGAADPASVCGLGLGLPDLPRRVEGAHLVYRGRELVLVVEANGRRLRFLVAPDDPDLPRFLAPLERLLRRPIKPVKRIVLERINDLPAGESPYLTAFSRRFEVARDHKGAVLFARPDWRQGGGG